MPTTWYDVLAVDQAADDDEIRSAFQREYRKTLGNLWSTDRRRRVTDAYAVLSNSSARRSHDLAINRWVQQADKALEGHGRSLAAHAEEVTRYQGDLDRWKKEEAAYRQQWGRTWEERKQRADNLFLVGCGGTWLVLAGIVFGRLVAGGAIDSAPVVLATLASAAVGLVLAGRAKVGWVGYLAALGLPASVLFGAYLSTVSTGFLATAGLAIAAPLGFWVLVVLAAIIFGRGDHAGDRPIPPPPEKPAAPTQPKPDLPQFVRRDAPWLSSAAISLALGEPARPAGQLADAFAALSPRPETVSWRRMNQESIEAAQRQLRPGEQILHVAVGIMHYVPRGIVVTDQRVGELKYGKQARWLELDVRSSATTRFSNPLLTRNHQAFGGLRIKARDATLELFEVQPPGAADAIARTLNSLVKGELNSDIGSTDRGGASEPKPSLASPGSYGAVDTTSGGTYGGGDFVGNMTRRRGHAEPLRSGASVKLELDDRGDLLLRSRGTLVARYPADSHHVTVDTTEAIGRKLKLKGLAATGFLAAAVPPLAPVTAAVGVAKSLKTTHRQAFALIIDDGDDYGVFSIDDSSFGLALVALRRSTRQAAQVVEAPSGPSGANQVDRLLTLARLAEAGTITEDEFKTLTSQLLGADETED